MKNLIKFAAACALLVGCEDSLDRTPIDQLVPETAFTNITDLERGVSGMYTAVPVFGELLVNSVYTDNTRVGGSNGGQRINEHQLNIAAGTNGDSGLYAAYGLLSNRASRVIASAGLLNIDPSNTTDLANRDNIVGQAYALRAFAHLKLFEYFTPSYTDGSGLSAPYVDFVAGSSDFPARATVAEYEQKLIADFDAADALLADGNANNLVTKEFVTFMRARFALARGQNVAAINFATTLIDNSGKRLTTRTEYPQMLQDLDDNEVFFRRAYILGGQGSTAGVWFFTGSGGEIMEVSTSLINAIDRANDGVRYNGIVLNGNINRPWGIGKYPGRLGVPFLNDKKEMRIAELYLIRAEAHARENQLVQAAANIKTLRDARLLNSPNITYSNQNTALTDILAERRIELAFEGHRWKDLKRFGRGFVRNAADCGGAIPCELNASDFRFTLPFPITEVLNNPNFQGNNPGY